MGKIQIFNSQCFRTQLILLLAELAAEISTCDQSLFYCIGPFMRSLSLSSVLIIYLFRFYCKMNVLEFIFMISYEK